MSQKYKLIIADTTNPAYSKMSAQVAQAIGAGLGYPNNYWVPMNDRVLVFNPNNKSVSVYRRNDYDKNDVIVAFTGDYLINSLQNPELNIKTVEAGDGTYNASIWEDSITFRSNKSCLVGCVTVPKDFIRKVLNENEDGDGGDLPEVSFHYPDSRKSYVNLFRVVRLTKLDDTYLYGYEIQRGDTVAIESGVFKKYVRNRIQANLNLRSFRS